MATALLATEGVPCSVQCFLLSPRVLAFFVVFMTLPAFAQLGPAADVEDPSTGGDEAQAPVPSVAGAGEPCDPPCPNIGVVFVPADEQPVGTQDCASYRVGVQWGGFGLALGFGSTTCPRWYVYTPGHYVPVPKNCYSAVVRSGAAGQVHPERFAVHCAYSGTPGISTVSCVGEENGINDPAIYNYSEQPCEE